MKSPLVPETTDRSPIDVAALARLEERVFADPAQDPDFIRAAIAAELEGAVYEEDAEQLDERLIVCLAQLKLDFSRGIVLVSEDATPDQYEAALKADKTAGQNWETLEARLLANRAALLIKAEAMPGGARLIGVYENGELAIRPRSQEMGAVPWLRG